jgi:hypothetical protein
MPYIVGVWQLCQWTGCHPSDLFSVLQAVSEQGTDTMNDSLKKIPSCDTFTFRPTKQCRLLRKYQGTTIHRIARQPLKRCPYNNRQKRRSLNSVINDLQERTVKQTHDIK